MPSLAAALQLAQELPAPVDQDPTAEAVVFWIFAVVALGSGIAMITMKNIVHAALMLVVNLLAIAALYLALQSQFLGIIQVIVYAGAIMVLFLFVIMLLGVDRDDLLFATKAWHKVAGALAAAALAGGLIFAVSPMFGPDARCGVEVADAAAPPPSEVRCVGLEEAVAANEDGSVGLIAERLFTRFTFPFEVAALLLVAATIGALVLGRRTDPRVEDEEGYTPAAGPVPPAGDGEGR